MRTLTSAMLAEVGATATRPGYLVQVGFSSTLRLSTLGGISAFGQPWAGADFRVAGLSADGSLNQSGQLLFANTWGDFGAIVLDEGVADKEVRIWAAYYGAPDDAVEVFSGAGDDASFDPQGRLTITLTASRLATAFWPDKRINAASGFNTLMPAGRRLTIGGQPYILERG